MTRNFIVIFSMLVLVSLVSCKAKNEPTNDLPVDITESLVYCTDSTYIYLCDHEWNDIVLGEQDPNSLLIGTPYKVPNRTIAKILHTIHIDAGSQRYLCVDGDTYYTFCFNNQGNITKAGTKTKYALRPVRVVAMPKDTIINL